ncbi:Uncharacterised protein [Klebsiella pneumoniae]|uniref:Uncharacterized protein n=1 Tax=Klebsiella pneumoniae TaxID=573 RepID=A0A2X3F0E9_KLEPN|nr:Uncharacterised protein [Klebsiella pneumoniae]
MLEQPVAEGEMQPVVNPQSRKISSATSAKPATLKCSRR